MITDLKPGDVVGLCGSATIVPEKCDCGRPATAWEPAGRYLSGTCEGCREQDRSWAAWREGLSARLDPWDADVMADRLGVAWYCLRSIDPLDVEEAQEEIERIRSLHGLPSFLACRPRPLSR